MKGKNLFAKYLTPLNHSCRVEVLNRFSVSCCDSSLLEYSMQEVMSSNPSCDMSVAGALVEDGDDLGQVSKYILIFEEQLCMSNVGFYI